MPGLLRLVDPDVSGLALLARVAPRPLARPLAHRRADALILLRSLVIMQVGSRVGRADLDLAHTEPFLARRLLAVRLPKPDFAGSQGLADRVWSCKRVNLENVVMRVFGDRLQDGGDLRLLLRVLNNVRLGFYLV